MDARDIDDFDDDWDGDDEGHPYDCMCQSCEDERNLDECGLLPYHLGGGCMLAGTEFCDWDCPVSRMGLDGREAE